MNLVVLQARMSSTRLPGKVLKEINGKPAIYWQIQRIMSSKTIDDLVVVTSTDLTDDVLVDYLTEINVKTIRGDLWNVLHRYVQAIKSFQPKNVIRLTADCPLFMPKLLDTMMINFMNDDFDYYSNIDPVSFPDGLDIEIMKSQTLLKLFDLPLSNDELEHVTLGIRSRKNLFSQGNYRNFRNLSYLRWTLDTYDDLNLIRQIYSNFVGQESNFTFEEVLDLNSGAE